MKRKTEKNVELNANKITKIHMDSCFGYLNKNLCLYLSLFLDLTSLGRMKNVSKHWHQNLVRIFHEREFDLFKIMIEKFQKCVKITIDVNNINWDRLLVDEVARLLRGKFLRPNGVQKFNLLVKFGLPINFDEYGKFQIIHHICCYLSSKNQDDVRNIEVPGELKRQLNLITCLFKHGYDINTVDGSGETSIFAAIRYKVFSLVPILLEFGLDLRKRSTYLLSALHIACYIKSTPNKIIERIIELTPEMLNQRDYGGETPFLKYLKRKNPSINTIKYMIDKGVNIHSTDLQDNNAFHLIFEHCEFKDESMLDLLEILLERGLRTDIKNIRNHTPIDLIPNFNKNLEIQITNLFLKYRKPINIYDHCAVF